MRLNSRELYIEAPRKRSLMHANAFYTRRDGVEKMRTRSVMTRSDTTDSCERSFSPDNGRTWSEWETVDFITETPEGVRRQGDSPGFVDPATDRLITIVTDGVLPTDDPLEGMKHWLLRYRVSIDGGRTDAVDEPIIQTGFTPDHPFDCVWVGRNSMMIGDMTCRPITTREGRILVPVQLTPVGPDGEYYNPGGGYTYHEAAVLIGTWRDDLTIEWDLSARVANDPAVSTRGCVEPTIAEMPDGRILMVLRGSNDAKPQLPGYKWYAVSEDGGRTWTRPEPWTYDDGENFFSPSSCSQLVPHSNGRCYWLGNLTPENPTGNLPRYPMVIAEVDPESLMLIRDSEGVVDDCGPGDDPSLTLSNFMAHEDRETAEIILHMSRFTIDTWSGDAYLYRIEP